MPGERALHMASKSGNVEIVRLLLDRSQADPNITDNEGCTPLLSTCACRYVCVEVVRLLLDSGADPGLADKRGFIPLHFVAGKGHIDLVEMLHSRAPTTLHRWSPKCGNPLVLACSSGHAGVVCKLLSLGAIDGMPPGFDRKHFLGIAVVNGSVAAAQVLINQGGIGRDETRIDVVCHAISLVIVRRKAALLPLLLMVDGAKQRSGWANTNFEGKPLLHWSVAYCYPAAVSFLLEAGADEEALARGPAYRARSWAWPSDKETGGGGGGDGDAAATPRAVHSSPSAVKTSSVSGVRIVRLEEKKIGNKSFAKIVARYCAKQ